MVNHWIIGVDGGGTKTTIRLEDATGTLKGEVVSGPANISLSVEHAWQSILQGLAQLQQNFNIQLDDKPMHVGMGLAGMEFREGYERFLQYRHPFTSLIVKSDAHIACLGAHEGNDGGIIIVGTGTVGFQLVEGQSFRTAGYGFPQDDEGSGAWLGLEAIKVTLKAYDSRMPTSLLSQAVSQFFHHDIYAMIAWARAANTTRFATLAPLVIAQSKLGCPIAIDLLKRAAKFIDHLGITMIRLTQDKVKTPLPITFIGGIAPFLQPFLSDKLKSHVVEAKHSCAKGAILMMQDHLGALNSSVCP